MKPAYMAGLIDSLAENPKGRPSLDRSPFGPH
jgi:hypothetical protein